MRFLPSRAWTNPGSCSMLATVFLSTWTLALVAAAAPVEKAPRTCIVQIEGVPRPQHSHHKVTWEDTWHELEPRIELPSPESKSTLRLEGPRYSAVRVIQARDCDSRTVLTVKAKPLPATIELQCAPRDTVLRCEDCDGPASTRWYLPDQFPPIAMEAASRKVVLRVKAVGYRDLRQEVSLFPGANVLRLDLERLESSPSPPR